MEGSGKRNTELSQDDEITIEEDYMRLQEDANRSITKKYLMGGD